MQPAGAGGELRVDSWSSSAREREISVRRLGSASPEGSRRGGLGRLWCEGSRDPEERSGAFGVCQGTPRAQSGPERSEGSDRSPEESGDQEPPPERVASEAPASFSAPRK